MNLVVALKNALRYLLRKWPISQRWNEKDHLRDVLQGCQMVDIQTKNHNLGKLLEGLRIVNVIICIEWSFGTFYGRLVYFHSFGNVVIIWYIFHHFVILCREKSGNPELYSAFSLG
jgi:hypothetical protein